MSTLLTELSSRAAELSREERAQLAEILLQSLAQIPLPEVEAAWASEVEARVAALERGEAQTVPAEEVFAQARRIAR
jgi:putative addiction module component (TIGR02574 family)